MSTKPASYWFSIGTDPYDGGKYWQGEWKAKFPDRETAKKDLIMGFPNPTALTGRYNGIFFPGVSLPVPDEEVIQLWSSEPEALANCEAYRKRYRKKAQPDHWPHNGNGVMMGLACEIHVREVSALQAPVIAGLLGDGSNTAASASPAGRFALSFSPRNRNALQVRVLKALYAGIVVKHRSGESLEAIQEKMKAFGEGLGMMSAYCNPTSGLEQLRRGARAPASEPYSIFQTRVYLDEELGLIANLREMDWRDVGRVDRWLFAADRWKKLLPLPKCMLVTRIRREDKSYPGMSAFQSACENHWNKTTLVWIRDGDNVWRYESDIDSDERIFPTGEDAGELLRRFREEIWQKHWKPAKADARWYDRDGKQVGSKELSKKPEQEEEPVPVRWENEATYPTLESWLDSKHYGPELDKYLRETAQAAARQHQREKMPFILSLQGIIDHKGILSIPPGTDVFGEDAQKFIRMVADFEGALVDPQPARQFKRMADLRSLKPGQKIIGYRCGLYCERDKERWGSHAAEWSHGSRGEGPFVFTVKSVVAPDPKKPRAYDNSGELIVHEWELTKRWVYSRALGERVSPFTKDMGEAKIDEVEWLPLDLPLGLAEKLLDDRAWKRANLWAVPVLAQWEKIRDEARKAPAGVAPYRLDLRDKVKDEEEKDDE